MSDFSAARPINVLLVEDSAADVRLTQEAFRDGKIANRLDVVSDGEQALARLRKEGEYRSAPRPDIILLDLNLPRKDGREVLAEVRADPALATIPIIILTTSAAERDIARSYQLHANCYITKPVDFEQFYAVVRSIEDFWLTVVKLPG